MDLLTSAYPEIVEYSFSRLNSPIHGQVIGNYFKNPNYPMCVCLSFCHAKIEQRTTWFVLERRIVTYSYFSYRKSFAMNFYDTTKRKDCLNSNTNFNYLIGTQQKVWSSPTTTTGVLRRRTISYQETAQTELQ